MPVFKSSGDFFAPLFFYKYSFREKEHGTTIFKEGQAYFNHVTPNPFQAQPIHKQNMSEYSSN